MKKIFWGAAGLAAFLLIAWLAGVRILVIQPIGAIPDGATIILHGAPGLAFVDSPDAFCMRHGGKVTLICRAAVLGGAGKDSTIILRLP